MRLKQIRLYGFKTFADKTEISLDGDIVAIVGPNGCGKSNVVDALVWGLGESNMRSVRAQTGKEVVFAGSAHRKPLGFAEVTVTFDNEDGALPVDAAEVSVTRRVDKSGENDYMINRRSCRLKDVVELLADTGLSRSGYAIVGQSEIDQALAASAVQRRCWIDEAAGVQRYRLRRTEAVRRLAAAGDHLARVRDVIVELERQEAPLAQEAEQARAYREVSNRLRSVESGLLAHELLEATEGLAEASARRDSLLKTVESLAAVADGACGERSGLEEAARKAEAAYEEARARAVSLARSADQATTRAHVARARLASLGDLAAALDEERTAGSERLAQAAEDLERAKRELESAEEALEALARVGEGHGEAAGELRRRLESAEEALAHARSVEERRLKAELEAAMQGKRAAEARRELEGAEKALAQLEEGERAAAAEHSEAMAAVEAAREAAEAAKAEAAELARREAGLEAARREALALAARLEGRRAGLQASLEAHDGLPQGARAVLDAAARGEVGGKFVPLGEGLVADPAHAAALDAALGTAAHDLVVEEEKSAKEAIRFLREHRLGRATFQPLSLVRGQGSRPGREKLEKRPGVVGFADGLVAHPPAWGAVVESVLGRVVVVETLDDAFRLVGTPGWSRAATLAGEIVFAAGAVRGGVAPHQSTGVVERKAELARVEAELEASARAIAEAEAERTGLARQAAAAREAADALSAQADEASKAASEAAAFLRAIEAERRETGRAMARLVAELESLQAPAEALEPADLAAAESAREDALKAWLAHDASSQGWQERFEAAKDEAGNARRRVEELERRSAAVAGAIQSGELQRENMAGQRAALEAEAGAAEKEAKGLGGQAAEAEGEADRHLAERAAAEEGLAALARQIAEAQRGIRDAETEANRLEVQAARLDLKRANALARLLEEYGTDEAAALESARSGPPEPDAASLAASLRKQLRALGEVNLGAVEAYDRLRARLDDLLGQASDIEEGKAQIEQSVAELDKLTKDKFEETFAEVAKAFRELFVETFGGGDAELTLVSPDEPLDTGVDIQVTLPGKRRQRLELLSGGERALGALTFLCALLKARPSPLVVLDEVDAPLDGRNVERFVSLLRSFEGQCQFVVVTHNQVTIESADVWLGVSMQEPGVSTVVPFRAPDDASSERALVGGYMKG